jgi:hypothetical protein
MANVHLGMDRILFSEKALSRLLHPQASCMTIMALLWIKNRKENLMQPETQKNSVDLWDNTGIYVFYRACYAR